MKRILKKIIESLRNLLRAGLDELYQTQHEDLFLRQFKGNKEVKK